MRVATEGQRSNEKRKGKSEGSLHREGEELTSSLLKGRSTRLTQDIAAERGKKKVRRSGMTTEKHEGKAT